VLFNLIDYTAYRAWLILSPDRRVEALPKLGAIAIKEAEIYRDTCSDRLFFAKPRSDRSLAVTMPVISMGFDSGSSAEIYAIASGADYEVHKGFKQRHVFNGVVNQNGVGVLEPSRSVVAKYNIDLTANASIECEGYSLAIADKLTGTQDIVLKPDGMFAVTPSLFGKKVSAYLQTVLTEDVVINKNEPLPSITLNTVLYQGEDFYFAAIANCIPIVEQFDPDSSTINLRLAFDIANVELLPLI